MISPKQNKTKKPFSGIVTINIRTREYHMSLSGYKPSYSCVHFDILLLT